MLVFLDKWPMRLETKGGTIQMVATHVFINSCWKPTEVYRSVGEDIKQLLRRIDQLWEFQIVAGVYVRVDRNPQRIAADLAVVPDLPMDVYCPEEQWYGPELSAQDV